MEQPQASFSMTTLAFGRVAQYSPDYHGLIVTIPSLQQMGLYVKVLQIGSADGWRIKQESLPVVGTWGLVAFPYGDSRAAVWLGSIFQSEVDAITISDPPTETDTQTKYEAHFSGAYSVLDYIGNYYYWSPDNTQIFLSLSETPPVTRRHTIDSSGNRQTVVVNNSDRVPNPPTNFYVSLQHPSGASLTITPSGTVTVVGGDPYQASLTITPSGQITVQTVGDQSAQSEPGPVIVLDPQAQIVTITGGNKESQIKIDGDGNIFLNGATGNKITVAANGSISIQSSSSNAINVESGGIVNVTSTGATNIIATGGAINLGEVTLKEVARLGDQVEVSLSTGIGTITSASSTVFAQD